MTANQFTSIKDELDISFAALSRVLDRATSTVQSYARKGAPDHIAKVMRDLARTGLSRSAFARKTGLAPPEPLREKRASEIAGQEVRLLPFSSEGSTYDIKYGVGRDGTVYSFRATGGTLFRGIPYGASWSHLEMSTKNGRIDFMRDGEAIHHQHARAVALAWAGPPPFPEAEAYVIDDTKPVAAGNIGWRAREERLEATEGFRGGRGGGPVSKDRETKVRLSSALALAIRKAYPEMVRHHGITYAVEAVLRKDVGLPKPLTPKQRQTGAMPHTKAAQIRLLAHRDPTLTKPEIADKIGDTSPEYVGKVLSESGIKLRELRRRRQIDKAVASSQRERRRAAIIQDGKSGLYTAREIGERYGIRANTVYGILSDAGVSLSEAKRRREQAVQERQS